MFRYGMQYSTSRVYTQHRSAGRWTWCVLENLEINAPPRPPAPPAPCVYFLSFCIGRD